MVSQPPADPNGVDITNQFDPSQIATPPIRLFIGGNDVMAGAEDKTWLGKMTEHEANETISRNVTITRWTDRLIDMLWQDSRFGYESKADVMRHAIEMLMDYFRENNAFLEVNRGFASEIIRRQQALRWDAERARQREDLKRDLASFDDEMDIARKIGDWAHVARKLQEYLELIRICSSETERRNVREIFASSLVTKAAVIAFSKWTHASFRPPIDEWDDGWPALADEWVQFYVDMQAPSKGKGAGAGAGNVTQFPTNPTPGVPNPELEDNAEAGS